MNNNNKSNKNGDGVIAGLIVMAFFYFIGYYGLSLLGAIVREIATF